MRQSSAELVTDLARNCGGIGNQLIQRTVLTQPFGGGDRPYAGNAGNVVSTVADQRQPIHHQRRRHTKLLLDLGSIGKRVLHGVQQPHPFAHQLSQVLVTAHDQHRQPLSGRLSGQGADHVVGLHSDDLQQWQTQSANKVMERRDLLNQIRVQRRTVRLVSGKLRMTKGLAGRIKNYSQRLRLIFRQQPPQHIQHPIQRSGWFASRGCQRWQRIKRSMQPGRTIDQNQRFGCSHLLAQLGTGAAQPVNGLQLRSGLHQRLGALPIAQPVLPGPQRRLTGADSCRLIKIRSIFGVLG